MYGSFNKGWHHIYEGPQAVILCGVDKKDVVKLIVTEDENGEYWGWNEKGKISMIWPSLIQLEMCFAYGLEAAEKTGRGKRTRLKISKHD